MYTFVPFRLPRSHTTTAFFSPPPSKPFDTTPLFSENVGLIPNFQFAQVHTCPGIDQLGRCRQRQRLWKTLHDKSGPELSPGQHPPRDSWGWSPEISSNPNRCNLTLDPGIVSGTESPSTSCPVTTEQWQRGQRRPLNQEGVS